MLYILQKHHEILRKLVIATKVDSSLGFHAKKRMHNAANNDITRSTPSLDHLQKLFISNDLVDQFYDMYEIDTENDRYNMAKSNSKDEDSMSDD